MSIALETSTSNRIERSVFQHEMSCGSADESAESGSDATRIFAGDRRLEAGETPAAQSVGEREEEVVVEDSSSSSSIGRNSDSSNGDGDFGEGEVQSSYKGPLETLDALVEVLPIERGMSKFYCGKSKSFTSLADAVSCSSIKEIAKPEDAYTRKRKNLLAHSIFWDKDRNRPPRSINGGLSKRPANSRSTLSLAATMSSYDSNNNGENSNSSSSPPTRCRPPLHPHGRRSTNKESSLSPPRRNFSPWRSFSLSDLHCAAATTPSNTDLVISNGDADKLQ